MSEDYDNGIGDWLVEEEKLLGTRCANPPCIVLQHFEHKPHKYLDMFFIPTLKNKATILVCFEFGKYRQGCCCLSGRNPHETSFPCLMGMDNDQTGLTDLTGWTNKKP